MTGGLTRYVHGDDVPVTIPRVPAREAAERELLKPVYHEDDPGIVQRAMTWFWDRVDSLLSAAAGATPGGWVGLTVIAIVIVLAVIALRLRLGRLRQATAGRGRLYEAARPRTAAEHRATAVRYAGRGRWTEAVQERMRALVRALEERALLDPNPGRTADEAAAEAARSLPGHAGRLRAAARSFDDVTYGGRAATEQAYRELTDLDTELARTSPVLAPAAGGSAP